MGELNGLVTIVTGGAKGIGSAIAKNMAQHGAKVLIADICEEDASKLAGELNNLGYTAAFIETDVACLESVQAMANYCYETFGKIDVLVNNAGLFTTISRKPFYELDLAEWDRIMAVNLRGTFICTRAVFPYMKNSSHGRIINIVSATVFKGAPNLSAYVASKAGVIGLTRSLARELGPFGISVNAVAPGHTQTYQPTPAGAEIFEKHAKERCFSRVQMPEDIPGAVIFLASSGSDFITGQTIVVDGGLVMI